MVFVEFTSSNFPEPGAKHHFVGASLEDVLADTQNGTHFGLADYSDYKEITEKEARDLGLGYLEPGIRAVQDEVCVSFMLTTPRTVTA